MSYTYTVPKRRANRVSYRILGGVFVAISVLQFVLLTTNHIKHMLLTFMFAFVLMVYGLYLITSSFRKQAFDITYRFDDKGMLVTHRYGAKQYSFDDIEFITMVIPDASLIYYMLNIKAGRDIYTIPFTMKKDYCEAIYEFVNNRIKKDNEHE
ncbi:MAG: hypothetical protein PUA62_10550 [Lachnospiraceae bacterium]|nr:hypothetical protein [Lachnospiraceae bacterium]